MRTSEKWVILDTETTGLGAPICPVEIAAQVMCEWQPFGDPFRVLINFDVPIDARAQAVHGYSREYLQKYGVSPQQAIPSFLDYVADHPWVAYNLNFDADRVLIPTLQRMQIPNRIRTGFCAMKLARNVVPHLDNHKLETVARAFDIAGTQVHHASDDVNLVVRLFSDHLGPHFDRNGISGLENIAACAKGLLKCPSLSPAQSKRNQMALIEEKATKQATNVHVSMAIGELLGMCRMIALDKQITPARFAYLCDWLKKCPHKQVPPISTMLSLIQDIASDGQVSPDEQKRLLDSIAVILDTAAQG
jgi:DNA polymerase III epsilon subunit-like protein